jgi:hypothetical protein
MVRRIGSVVGGGASPANPPPLSSPHSRTGEISSSRSHAPKTSISLPTRTSLSLPLQPPFLLVSSKTDNDTTTTASLLSKQLPPPPPSSSSPLHVRATSEIATVILSARPSEVRAAAKAGRVASRAERERQQLMLQSQQEAQMKMNKIRAEIDAIKAKESGKNLVSGTRTVSPYNDDDDNDDDDTHRTTTSKFPSDSSYNQSTEKEILPSIPDVDSRFDDILAFMGNENTNDLQLKEIIMGKKLWEGMEVSCTKLGMTSGKLSNSSCSQYESSLRDQNMSQVRFHDAYRSQKQPCYLVPEMRRRATSHDLLFDDEQIHIPSSTLWPMSTHSPVTGNDMAGNNKAKSKMLAPNQDLGAYTVHVTDRVQLQARESPTEPSPPTMSPTNRLSEPTSPIPLFRCRMTTSRSSPKRDAKTVAKMEEEKQKDDAKRQQLRQAKMYFLEGHDLCWKLQDSASVSVTIKKAFKNG